MGRDCERLRDGGNEDGWISNGIENGVRECDAANGSEGPIYKAKGHLGLGVRPGGCGCGLAGPTPGAVGKNGGGGDVRTCG
jgi:hypothetical protein